MNIGDEMKKRIVLIVSILTIGLFLITGTYALLTWRSSNSQQTNVTFNLPANFADYIDVKGDATFVGDLNISDSYLNGIHSTVTISKKEYLKDVNVYATLYLKINEIGDNIKKSSALKWVVTSGNSTNPGSILSQGNFYGKNKDDTITLLYYQEVTLEVQEYTIWIYLDANENPSSNLSGETLDVDVLTEINQVITDKFEITSKSYSNSTIRATAINTTYNIVGYAVTTSSTTPSTFTTIPSSSQNKIYNLEYPLSGNVTGDYYIWFKDSKGNIINTLLSITTVSFDNIVVTLDDTEYAYTGSEIKPIPTVTINGNALVEGTDYTISYNNNINIGTASLTVTGNGNYSGTKTINFTIADKTPPTCTISGNPTTWTTSATLIAAVSDNVAVTGYAWSNSAATPSTYTTINTASTNLTKTITTNQIIYMHIKDAAGNTASCSANVEYLDSGTCTAPTIMGSVANNTWATSNTITITGGNCASGVNHYVYCVSTTGSSSSNCTDWSNTYEEALNYNTNGTYYIFARAVSNSKPNDTGEGNGIGTFTVRIDKDTPAAPTITGTTASGSWATSNTLTISGSSSTSGIQKYEYCDSTSESSCTGTWNTYTSSMKYNTCGKKYVFARAINNVPTTGTVSSPYKVFILPTTPTITASNSDGEVASDNWSTKDVTITITGTGDTSCVNKYEYCTSTTSSTSCTSWQTYSQTNKPVITYEGTTYVFARATNSDSKSSSSTSAYIVKISKTAPTCALEATANGVKFKSYSSDVVAWGLSNDSTPVYNGTASSTLPLSAGTKYGYVKNEMGNVGVCTKPITSATNTYTCSKDATPLYTCNKGATPVYTCTKAATVSGSSNVSCNTSSRYNSPSTQCSSGYTYNGNSCSVSYSCTSGHTLNGTTCSYGASESSYTCRTQGTTKYTCTCPSGHTSTTPTTQNACTIYCNNYYGDSSGTLTTSTTCPSPWPNAHVSSGGYCYVYQESSCRTWTKVGTNYTCDSNSHSLSGSNCSYTATPSYTGTINCNTYSCSTGTLNGTNCNLTNQTSCSSGWTKSDSTGYTCPVGTLNGSNCYQYNQASCSSGWTKQDEITGYTCSTGTLNGSSCYLYEQSSCSSGWTSESNPATCKTGTKIGNYCIDDVWTITLDNQSATTAGTTSITVELGQSLPSISVPSKTGYTFGGYYSGTNGTGTQYYTSSGTTTQSCTSSTPITLYAKWTANTYTITFNPNEGSVSQTTKTVTYGSTYGELPTPTRTAYNFTGWYTAINGGTQVLATDTVNITSNITLYARWVSAAYTVTYNCNGGGTAPATLTCYAGTDCSLTTAATACSTYKYTKGTSGSVYYVNGWSTSSSATSPTYTTSINKSDTSNVTLYAVYNDYFSYTGSYEVCSDSDCSSGSGTGNWRIMFKSSGTYTSKSNLGIDIFLVGGGGGGASTTLTNYGSGGGGGGYTKTYSTIMLTQNGTTTVTIGSGGAIATAGGSSSFGTSYTVNGGRAGTASYRWGTGSGGAGGSGGGAGAFGDYSGGSGGSNGGNGGYVGQGSNPGSAGTGQGTTTRAFGETSGTLYASGGTGGGRNNGNGTAGGANTGNGGGGGGTTGSSTHTGAAGGSGIIIIRNAR